MDSLRSCSASSAPAVDSCPCAVIAPGKPPKTSTPARREIRKAKLSKTRGLKKPNCPFPVFFIAFFGVDFSQRTESFEENRLAHGIAIESQNGCRCFYA